MIGERLHIDFETRSACDLKSAGAYRYSIDPTTEVTDLAWSFEPEVPKHWRPGLPFPRRVAEHVAAGGEVIIHNAAFERRIWNHVLRRQVPGLAEMRIEQQNCTLARALAMSYPDDLETLSQALGSPDQERHGRQRADAAFLQAIAHVLRRHLRIPHPYARAGRATRAVQYARRGSRELR